LLLGWSHHYKYSTVVITIWLTITKYHYLKWQWIFYFIRRLFFPLSLSVLLPNLTLYMSNMVYTLWTPEFTPLFFGGVRVPHIFSFLCCSIMCLYVLSSMLWCPIRFPHKKQCLVRLYPQVVCSRANVLFMLFVFVCLVLSNTYCVVVFFTLCTLCCQSLWIVHFLLPIRYSLMFILKSSPWFSFQSSGINVEVII
jgi:hypothetical protein